MQQESKPTSSKLRLSPSAILRAGRCPHTVAMEILYPGKGVAEDMKSTLAQGYFFEHQLTGKKPGFREQPAHEAYYRYLNRAHQRTLDRIQSYATTLREMYLPDEYETGVFHEFETPEFVLAGEIDVEWFEGDRKHIVDAKFISNTNDVFDPYGRLYIREFMMQPPTYAMLDCIKQSNDPKALYWAASLLIANKDFMGKLESFMDGVTIPRCSFLACEPREVNYSHDPFEDADTWGMPLHKFHEIELQSDGYDLVVLMSAYIMLARKINAYVLAGNQYHQAIAGDIKPDEVKCLGKNTTGKHGGYCPWVGQCTYAQTHLFNKSSISLNELWNLDS